MFENYGGPGLKYHALLCPETTRPKTWKKEQHKVRLRYKLHLTLQNNVYNMYDDPGLKYHALLCPKTMRPKNLKKEQHKVRLYKLHMSIQSNVYKA